MTHRVVILPGDGIGPEVVTAARHVLDAVTAGELEFEYETRLIGGAAIDAYGTPLRDEDLEDCKHADAVLLGAVGGPAWDHLPVSTRPERALLRLRQELGVGINLRPVWWNPVAGGHSPLKPEVVNGADIAFVRELTGGVYFGRPSYIENTDTGRVAVDTGHYTEQQIAAVVEFACALAATRQGKVTSVDKANVMNTSRLWRDVAGEVAQRHPEIELEHALVDSFAMSLIQDPRRYDVVVTENLFGDILTDLASVIGGSLGVLPSASLRPGAPQERFGLYEPIHGSAPTIAGKNMANPAGCILSIALMVEWSFGRPDLAATIRKAVDAVLAEGILTVDLAGPDKPAATTEEFAGAVVAVAQAQGEKGEGSTLRHHVA